MPTCNYATAMCIHTLNGIVKLNVVDIVYRDVMVKMATLVEMETKVQRATPDHQDPLAHQDPPEKLDMALLDPRYCSISILSVQYVRIFIV